MKFISDINDLKLKNTVVILGNFDGIHKGHLALIRKAIELGEEKSLQTVFFTFYPHPTHVLAPTELKLINTDDEKQQIARSMGIDYYVRFPFTMETASIEPEAFIKELLHERLGAKAVVVGEDYSFGKGGRNGKGDIRLLKEKEAEYGYELHYIEKLTFNQEIISSTWLRKAIHDGEFEIVKKLMGRDYFITGKVVRGAQLGRQIGFPTANIKPNEHKQLPKHGVYITKVDVEGKTYMGLTNVGTKPTIDESYKEVLVETYIYDFDKSIYGEEITVHFQKYLRSEDIFETIQDLIDQMKKDEKELIRYYHLDK